MTRFKAGDIVKIKEFNKIDNPNISPGIMEEMQEFCGHIFVICEPQEFAFVSLEEHDNISYPYFEDEINGWLWTEEWLEPATINSYKRPKKINLRFVGKKI